eukprot:CAMPEP_0171800452 /NCGR_PEP_ID=MMETSP0991-20121206/71691_1 /TAXON_ID=483369 /ORGANISM="non described non described, Strain CCMP2098" /LENGTH=307 /DNA_ID=CAMNT_0012411971 /DNA_START=98 /DNA_END=1021 /DNA_ORIENTATION=+
MSRCVGARWVFLAIIQQACSLHIAITGTSQGIGLDAAKRLISEGHTVYHACRSAERAGVALEGAGGGEPMVCDLSSLASVRAFATELKAKAPRLDVLCLNAGIAPSTKAAAPKLTVDGFEECIGTNHLGHFLLAVLLQPHLSSNGGAGRVVVTASSVHDPNQPGGAVGEYDGGKVYKDSKLCNVLFAREAKKRWPSLKIRSFNPGFIPSSGLFRAPREDNWLGATAFTFFARAAGFSVPIEVGGERLAYLAAATDDDIPNGSYLSAPTGSSAARISDGFNDGEISLEAADSALAARLWEVSTILVST